MEMQRAAEKVFVALDNNFSPVEAVDSQQNDMLYITLPGNSPEIGQTDSK